jgi:DNA-binding CsgD family transcriptional regulator
VLLGRRRECDQLELLLDEVRGGASRALVLRGEPGAGKTALLDHASSAAAGFRTLRAAGVEPEAELAYAGLQQLCAPLLEHTGRLPAPQRTAVEVAFGLAAGDPPDALLIGLGLLGLLGEAARERPLLVLVDDLQWFDPMSQVIVLFAARRLGRESVALILAARPGDDLPGLPTLPVEGLADAPARELLATVLTVPVDDRVRDRILAETRGNPLALLELPRGLDAAELSFGLGVPPADAPVGNRVAAAFRRRIDELPPDTRTLLAAAAVEPTGDPTLLWQALARLSVAGSAAAPAEAAGLLDIGSRVRFRHPLVRSEAWRAVPLPRLRAIHQALAEVTDPLTAADRRAWHRAHATTGPDEEVAAELERAASAALARGGRAAAAVFLERATELSPDPARHAARALAAAQARAAAGQLAQVPALLDAAELGPLDALARASVARLRARLAPTAARSVPLLVEAARELAPLDAEAAREATLDAIAAGLEAGRRGGDELRAAAGAARELSALNPAASPEDLEAAAARKVHGSGEPGTGPLLDALVARVLDGKASFRVALDGLTPGRALQRLPLAVAAALDAGDDEAWHRVTGQALAHARETGAIGLLPTALAHRAVALVVAGETAEARALAEAAATAGGPGAAAMLLAAVQGREDDAMAMLDAAVKEGDATGRGRLLGLAAYAKALLDNGLGRYPSAADAARMAAAHDDVGWLPAVLTELVEASARGGLPCEAEVARLTAWAEAAGTPWALGRAALAAAVTGTGKAAEDGYREAVDRLGTGRLGLPLARAKLLYGEWLRRENRRAEARSLLRDAHESLDAMGADGFAQRARRELAATGETVRRRSDPARWDLTAQEEQIARLAAAGHTNPEIGAELFLSPRTVEWHLRKVFGKLGVTSRRELRGL